ncbi:UNVERIFIED_CONTAM: putative pumilio21 [Sesamum calycinum]|uniref:Pumilio21 n=1 Tax=Sesamum calycinum TaxID=2727403 RepID=A0AAW2STL4_9LAMI
MSLGFNRAPTANSQSNNGDDDSDTSSVFLFKTHEERGPVTTTRSKNINIAPCVLGQDNSATTNNSIWGCPHFFMTTSPGEKDMRKILSKCSIRQTRSNINHQAHQKSEEVIASCHGYDRVLSTRFMDIMTHPTARDVILQCLILFPRQPNETKWDVDHYCIALIGGDQRVRFLDQITDVSDFLSYDPYGNYVIQNLLGLKNKDVTKKITSRLQNEIMGLAKRRGGCLVVEKCMEASDDEIITVAMEILDSGSAALRLAGNQFRNYVIEAVLKKTKEHGFNSLYNAIVRRLEAPLVQHGSEVLQLLSSHHPRMVLVSSPLDGKNFLAWNRAVKRALGAKMKLGFITGTCKKPSGDPELNEQWTRVDCMVVSWLLNAMTKNVSNAFIYAKSTRTLWIALNERYGECNGPQLYQLERDIASITQGDLTIVDYFTKIQTLWDELVQLRPMPECMCGCVYL